ncbi:Cation efflux system protein CusF [Rhodocyclaceae bacterium]|nr:Cation efflux system protein CusF [Rhodocyclaceae bacterium]
MKNQLIAAAAVLFAIGASADSGHSHPPAAGKHESGHTHAEGHGQDEPDIVGLPGEASKVTRTINVDMTDTMRFIPANVAAKQGETIRFVVKNSGRLKHEFVLGTEKGLKAHYEQMKKFPEMEHAESDMVTVAPGKTGEVIWQFTQSGTVDFACLQPGHYDAGMKGAIRVMAVTTAASDVLAQSQSNAASASTTRTSVAEDELTEGEVRKVDKENRKITLKHGEIGSLGMPGMTMVFQVKEATLLDAVKQGDKVRFKAERTGGAIVVTEIRHAK